MIKLSAAALIVALAALITGCGGETYNEEELKIEAAKLIEASIDINEICFGRGLPADFSATENGGEYKAGSAVYAPVDESSPYKSVADLKNGILKVYSQNYSSTLFVLLFEGVSVSAGSGNEEGPKQNVVYARYMDGYEGLEALLMNPEDLLTLDRLYDTDKINVLSQKKGVVEISVPSYVNEEYDKDVTFTLVYEQNGWRLDTPTY